MEKKLANMELNEEAMEKVSGGIVHESSDLGMAGSSIMVTQQNLDVAQNLILDDMTNPVLGAQVDAAQIGLIQEVAQNIIYF